MLNCNLNKETNMLVLTIFDSEFWNEMIKVLISNNDRYTF